MLEICRFRETGERYSRFAKLNWGSARNLDSFERHLDTFGKPRPASNAAIMRINFEYLRGRKGRIAN